MYKLLSLLLCVALFPFCLVGCGTATVTSEDQTLSIVTTIFPSYDWVREILGEQVNSVELTLLTGNGVDFHSFQPSVEDILAVSSCDLFLYVGGESDDWVEDALAESTNEQQIAINLLSLLGDGAYVEEIIEGMEDEDEEEEEEDEEEIEYDEHVWLSLSNAELFCSVISSALVELDPQHEEDYVANLTSYTASLVALDEEYRTLCESAEQKTLLFADRFPFRYLVEDYGLTYYAAFVGCSAETEASFATIIFLAEKVDELGLETILTIEGSDQKIAQTVLANTQGQNQTILTLNSMQSVTSEDIAQGASYLALCRENLAVLEQTLQ